MFCRRLEVLIVLLYDGSTVFKGKMFMKNQTSQKLVALFAVSTIVLTAVGWYLGDNKPSWMLVATPLSLVLTLLFSWLFARNYTFDSLDEVAAANAYNEMKQSEGNLPQNALGNEIPMTHRLNVEKIRVFSSVQDAQSHGWNFENTIGRLGDTPIFELAVLNNKTWKYDGLTNVENTANLAEDVRLFGKMRYVECSSVADPSPQKSVVDAVVVSHASPSPVPAYNGSV